MGSYALVDGHISGLTRMFSILSDELEQRSFRLGKVRKGSPQVRRVLSMKVHGHTANTFTRNTGVFSQRVIVKTSYSKNTNAEKWAKLRTRHFEYLTRSSSSKDGKVNSLFNSSESNIAYADYLKRSANDQYDFRFILSPENSA